MNRPLRGGLALICLVSTLGARAILPENIDAYTITAPASDKMKLVISNVSSSSISPSPVPAGTVAEPGVSPISFPSGSAVTPAPVSSIQTPLLAAVDNHRIIGEQISDHTLEGHLFQGDIPIYTWNLWAFGALNGFFVGRESDVNTYRNTRFTPQVEIIRKLFNDTPNAIVCLQEVSQSGFDFIGEIQRALSDLNIGVEYSKKTGTESFGQIILYRKDKYQYVRPSSDKQGGRYSNGTAAPYRFKDEVNVQDDRVLKVYFQERTGKGREIAVVNVHLKWYPDTPKKREYLTNLIRSLSGYASGARSPKPAVIITGDFNYDLNLYTESDSKIAIYPVGRSYTLNQTGQAVKVTDGFIEIQP